MPSVVSQLQPVPVTLPVGVRPNTIHKEFYDNLVEGPHALDVDDKYLCNIPEIAYPESRPEPVHYETSLLPTIRNVVAEAVPKNLAQPPCICLEMIESSFVAQDPRAYLVSYLEKPNSGPRNCPHRAASVLQHKSDPNVLPRLFARVFVHDESLGYQTGAMYEQQIGSTVLARNHNTPVTIKDQPNYTHYWMYKNYGIALDAPCCDKCDAGILSLLTVLSSDTVDRLRDRVVGEMFNVNNVLGRQTKLALETWKGFNIHGTYGFCCKRTKDISRCIRNMGVWLYTNPVYYTHKWGQDDGLMEFVEALNGFMMNE
ncbi:hypothetical protein TWF788_008356, partial [Orbilia oligospora]